MSSERVNPFAEPAAAPPFAVKPKAVHPINTDHIERLARETNFPSRQAPKLVEPTVRKRRVHKTGRNQQLNFKATAATVDRFYSMADKNAVPLCELLELALDALEKQQQKEP